MQNSAFYKQIEHWVKITRLLLTHGASPQTTCKITIQPGKLGERVNLRKESPKVTSMYSALDVIGLIFGGDSRYDVPKLEDRLDEQQQHLHSRYTSKSNLQVPARARFEGRRFHSASFSSQNSRRAGVRRRGKTLLFLCHLPSFARPGSVAEYVPSPSQNQGKHSRLWSWLRKR